LVFAFWAFANPFSNSSPKPQAWADSFFFNHFYSPFSLKVYCRAAGQGYHLSDLFILFLKNTVFSPTNAALT
jgi:hypothetical protein